MTVAVTLSEQTEARLRARARAAGVEPAAYAAHLLDQTLQVPDTILHISGDLTDRFAQSGMTEEQLADLLEQEKHAARADRRGSAHRE